MMIISTRRAYIMKDKKQREDKERETVYVYMSKHWNTRRSILKCECSTVRFKVLLETRKRDREKKGMWSISGDCPKGKKTKKERILSISKWSANIK